MRCWQHTLLMGWQKSTSAIDLGRTLCLAPVPVLSKQIEENLLLWVLANHLLVEFYSKSWPLREREVSFYYAGISRCGRFYPILSKVVKVFLNLEVGCGGCKEIGRASCRERV